MKNQLALGAVICTLAGCSTGASLDMASTCADWLETPADDQRQYVKERRSDVTDEESARVAILVGRSCQSVTGSTPRGEVPLTPLVQDSANLYLASKRR